MKTKIVEAGIDVKAANVVSLQVWRARSSPREANKRHAGKRAIAVWLPVEEYEDLRALAQHQGLCLTTWARVTLLRAAGLRRA